MHTYKVRRSNIKFLFNIKYKILIGLKNYSSKTIAYSMNQMTQKLNYMNEMLKENIQY